MTLIDASEKYLSYKGDAVYALALVESLHEAYCGNDMQKMLNDFCFNIEIAVALSMLQRPLAAVNCLPLTMGTETNTHCLPNFLIPNRWVTLDIAILLIV